MIRFCDKEVCCVTEGDLDRQQLLAYFLGGHRNEPVCILKESGEYMGSITYDSLLGRDISDAVKKDSIVLDRDIWKKGREYFKSIQKEFGGVDLLPVLDKERRLLCYAWEDEEANRELRMLDELSDCSGALDFKDVYPEYDCVTIRDLNELSFFFAEYLINRGVPVKTEGALWEALDIQNFTGQEEAFLDFRRLVVYGEGTAPQEERIELRNSVSAEFECIDRIYEENVRKGLINDTEGCFKDILDRLRGKQICILGIGEEALNAYDLLLGYGLDISCFIRETAEAEKGTLFGKNILNRAETGGYRDAVFIEVDAKYGAWGTAELDYYHYLGYKRNERFFTLRDYIEIPENGLRNVINHIMGQLQKRLVLTGDPWLCLKLKEILEAENEKAQGRIAYCDILEEYEGDCEKLVRTARDELCIEDICLLLLPEYYGCNAAAGKMTYLAEEMERYRETLKRQSIKDMIVYPLNHKVFYETEADIRDNGSRYPSVGKILIGSIEGGMGNIFFRGILDKHPNIIMLPQGYLNSNLFSICIRLSVEKNSEILSGFWKIYDKEEPKFRWSQNVWGLNKENFNQNMKEMLAEKDRFTSQELFVMLHIAFARAFGNVPEVLSDAVIYWEPHHVVRRKTENYAEWLRGAGEFGYIVNIVRDAVIRAGTIWRFMWKNNINQRIIPTLLSEPSEEKREYDGWDRIILRFEDLKLNPQKELLPFCDKMGIPWSDELINVRTGYGDVTGFDLVPVYRTNEDCLSSFDRFRLSLVTRLWQKRYGYPYVNSLNFSRKELWEIFSKKFRFEEELIFLSDEEKTRYLKLRRSWIERRLWEVRCREIMEEE